MEALADYLTEKHGTECFGTVRPRIAHFQAFLEEKNKTSIFCGDVDERLITDFRDWSQKKKVVTGKGKNRKIRQRALGTTEGSVRQIIAAINLAYKHKNVKFPAKVQALKAEEVSKSPSYRSDVLELAMMFDYCLNPKRTTQKRWSPKIASKVRTQRHSLLRFLQFSVATWCRLDAAYDFSVDPSRKQWDPLAKAISLNPANRVQTKKYRPVIPAPRQIVELFRDSDGFFVPVKSVRKAFEAMQDELCLPRDRETGPKLIRRSMANLVRPMLGETQWPQGKLMMGHQKGDISDLYAPARPDYMGLAMRATEEIIDQIEALAPGAFTGASPEITTAKGAVNV
ncbi:phage integrase SAM-like domain-containing protein [Porphyrobacter sp. TH134]|uniref:phage integrase SAM-like domain-containing protein n=1 Tax=Porphyrobacter sp. TH134 TaxID=2067450 RepID=UPI00117BE3FA|nr:phage integrase SAM-like domain-containing protein [Porphyrobacter sp. TH134]